MRKAKTQISLRIHAAWPAFAVRMKKLWVLRPVMFPHIIALMHRMLCKFSCSLLRLTVGSFRGFRRCGTGEQWHLFQGDKGLKTERNMGIKLIVGNREHRKSIFQFWGTGKQSDLFKRGTGTPLGGAQLFRLSV